MRDLGLHGEVGVAGEAQQGGLLLAEGEDALDDGAVVGGPRGRERDLGAVHLLPQLPAGNGNYYISLL